MYFRVRYFSFYFSPFYLQILLLTAFTDHRTKPDLSSRSSVYFFLFIFRQFSVWLSWLSVRQISTARKIYRVVLRAGLTYCGALSTCQSRCPPGPPSLPPDKYTVHQHMHSLYIIHVPIIMYVVHRSLDLFIIEHLSKAEAHILALRSLNLPFKYIGA